MFSVIAKKTYVPKFMSCSSFDEPELNYVYHSQTPRLVVEVADGADVEEKQFLLKEKILYKEVKLEDGDVDFLVLVDLIDLDFFKDKSEIFMFDQVMNVLDDMAEWHKKEVADLENYKD